MSEPSQDLVARLADRYRVERQLGQGGMSTVYLAHDLKHDRPVAVKVLRPELAAVIGAERFLAEIKTTANLQHPHILPLHDSGTVDGTAYYVMPLVDGESLRERLTREKQLPVADALRIATEVASALDYAHRHGVIHRDIKPENILLQDGQALVADFGIALAATTAGGARITETGLSLGTPQYMSPEQAMGERMLDARTDVYALGCVLYEMLTGEPPFTGPTAQAIVAKVMTAEPVPPSQLRRSVPPEVDEAVMTALEKLPADRWGSAGEFTAALTGGTMRPARARALAPSPAQKTRDRGLWLGSLAIVAGAFYVGGRLAGHRTLSLEFGRATQITSESGLEVIPALSPDGRAVAYAGGTTARTRIFVRAVAGGRSIRLTDDNTTAETEPHWSADGSRILFLARGGAFSAPASGGPARQELPSIPDHPITSAVWSPDGSRIAYVVEDSLLVRDDGGARLLAWFAEPASCAWSPDGSLIACASGNQRYVAMGRMFGNLSPSRIVICRVADGGTSIVTDSTSLNQSPVWTPDGRWLLYVSSRNGPRDVYALRVGGGGKVNGSPVRLTTGLGAQSISLSADGRRMAYSAYIPTANLWSIPFPEHPPVTIAAATPVTSGRQVIERSAVSRDGRWIYYTSDRSGNGDLYRLPLAGGEPERLTDDPSDDFSPSPSPDGREVAFHSWRGGSRDIYVLPLDGGPVQRVTATPLQEAQPVWSPDGSAIAFNMFTPPGGTWIVRRSADGKWGTPIERQKTGYWAVWSPDGRFLLTSATLLGGALTIMPVDSGAGRVLLDPEKPGIPPGEQGYWSADGRTIYFNSHDSLGNASIWAIPSAGGTPRLLVRFNDPARQAYRPEWSMGAGRIFFTIDDRQSDVWVMDVTRTE